MTVPLGTSIRNSQCSVPKEWSGLLSVLLARDFWSPVPDEVPCDLPCGVGERTREGRHLSTMCGLTLAPVFYINKGIKTVSLRSDFRTPVRGFSVRPFPPVGQGPRNPRTDIPGSPLRQPRLWDEVRTRYPTVFDGRGPTVVQL